MLSAQLVRKLARASFAATLVTLPVRFRHLIMDREFPPIYGDYTDFLLFVSDYFFLATLTLWLISLALEPRRLKLGPFFLTFPIFGLSIMGLISALTSIDPLLSTYHAIRLALLAGFYLYVLNEIESFDRLILPISILVFSQAVVGIGQVLRQQDLGLQALGEYEMDPAWRGVSIVWAEGIRSLRAYGLSDHPNLLGGTFSFSLVFIATWYLVSRSGWQTLTGAIFITGALGLLLTFSRSAWLALTLATVFILWLLIKMNHIRAVVNYLSLIGASLIVIAPFLWHNAAYIGVRLNWQNSFSEIPQEIQSLGSRSLLNGAANEIFAANALTGSGLGTFPLALRQLYPEFPIDYQPAHIVLLDVAAETGIFGALFYAVAITTPWIALWLNRRRLDFSPVLIGVSGLLLAVTTVGFFDHYTWALVPGRLWQWLFWGLWGLVYSNSMRTIDHD